MEFLKNNKGFILFYLMTAVFALIVAYKPAIESADEYNVYNNSAFVYNQK